MDEIAIRRGGRGDLEALVPLFDAYRAFYGRPSDPEAVRRFLSERVERGDSVILLGTAAGGPAPGGFAQLYPVPSSVSLGRAWILNDLFVTPAARGRGLGRALLEAAEHHGRTTGARYLELMTERTNAPARRLYASLGWTLDRRFLHYERDLGRDG